jgi:ADP-ribosylglycohydrolase
VAVAGAVALAVEPGPVYPDSFLETLAEWVAWEDGSVARAITGVASWLELDPVQAARHLHASGLDPGQVGEWQGISAFVTPSVAWSLYAFLRTPDDYWSTVCTAIAVGGDTDTMAAMAGAIAGARLGPSALPQELLGRLNDRGTWRADELAALATDCAELCR